MHPNVVFCLNIFEYILQLSSILFTAEHGAVPSSIMTSEWPIIISLHSTITPKRFAVSSGRLTVNYWLAEPTITLSTCGTWLQHQQQQHNKPVPVSMRSQRRYIHSVNIWLQLKYAFFNHAFIFYFTNALWILNRVVKLMKIASHSYFKRLLCRFFERDAGLSLIRIELKSLFHSLISKQ